MKALASGNALRFVLQVLKGRWFMALSAFLLMSVAGHGYLFGIYSPEIKSTLGYDQTTLNLLSFFKDLGSNVGVHAGLLMEVSPPWVVLLVGVTFNFFGYFMIWLAVTSRIPKPAAWQMFLYICIGSNSSGFANTGGIIPCVKNFPESRGVILGLLKGFVGISGGILSQLYLALYGNDPKSLILLLAWLPSLVSLIVLRTIRYMKYVEQKHESKIFYQILYLSLSLAGYLMVITLLQQRFKFTRTSYIFSGLGVLMLVISPIFTVVREEHRIWKDQRRQELDNVSNTNIVVRNDEVQVTSQSKPSSISTSEDPPTVPTREADSCFQNVFHPPNRGEDYTILQALFSMDMAILFIVSTCGLGGTLTAIDNLGQIGASQGYSKQSVSTCVSLISIWNYLGRVMSGFVSEYLLKNYKFPRPLMLSIILLVTCGGHLLIAFDVKNGLYIASVIIGFCFGAQWPMVYAIISELFGLKYYSTLYNLGTIASPIGNYVLNVRVAGSLYDKEATRQMHVLGQVRRAGEELNCNGTACFRLAFIIISALTLFSMFMSFILVVRTRKFYSSDIYKKFKGSG